MATAAPPSKPRRPPPKVLHARPLPLQTYPLPAVIPHNPLTLLRVAYVLVSHALAPPSSHPYTSASGAVSVARTPRGRLFGSYTAYYDAATRSVHVTDEAAVRVLWEQGFFGKGSLSRSEPEWFERAERRLLLQKAEAAAAEGPSAGAGEKRGGADGKRTAAEVTNARREERREEKRQRAKREADAVEEQLRAEARAVVGGDGVRDDSSSTKEHEQQKQHHLQQQPQQEDQQQQQQQQQQPNGSVRMPKKQALARGVLVINGRSDARGRRSRRQSRKRKRVRFLSQPELIPPKILPIGSPSTPPSTVEATMAALQQMLTSPTPDPPSEPEPEERLINQEHLQLNPAEAFFLAYGLGVLTVVDPIASQPLSVSELLGVFRRGSYFPPLPSQTPPLTQPDDPFLLSYVVYHHFRSLGWVVRPGIKFAVDFLLYNRGPVFSHAEFAVLILPSYSHPHWLQEARRERVRKRESKDWWWLHCANRVQGQVRKSLVLVYVDIPPPSPSDVGDVTDVGALLRGYKVREFVIGRWSMNRNRD